MKKKIIAGIVVGILCIISVSLLYLNKGKEEKRQLEIEKFLSDIKEDYKIMDFRKIELNITNLEELGYDTSELKEVMDYDKSVADDSINFYLEIKKIDNNLKSYSVPSMKTVVYDLKNLLDTFDKLPENQQSEIGKYVYDVKNNEMYKSLKKQLETNVSGVDFDNSLVKDGYIMVFETYTNEIAKIEYPYNINQEE